MKIQTGMKDKELHVAQSFEYLVAEISDVSDANTYCRTISVFCFFLIHGHSSGETSGRPEVTKCNLMTSKQ